MRATQAIIHTDNFIYNLEAVRRAVPAGTKLCLAIKANAYGHGSEALAPIAREYGVSCFAVAAASEGARLRAAGITEPILVLSLPLFEEIPELFAHNLTPLVFSEEFVLALEAEGKKQGKTLSVHIKVDTGMGRVGCPPETAPLLVKTISEQEHLALGGVCTHFAVADSTAPEDVAFTKAQIDRFKAAVADIRTAGVEPGIVHAASSAAIFLYPEAHFDMVRPGICAYGYSPAPGLSAIPRLKPVMEFVTHVVAIRRVQKGTSISYGRTWIAPEDGDIAVLPVGYADGLARALSNRLSVTINGTRYPVVGRICMDQCMVWLDAGAALVAGGAAKAETSAVAADAATTGGHGVQVGDKAVVYGGDSGQTAATLAETLGTIPYELLCAVSPRVPRIYTP